MKTILSLVAAISMAGSLGCSAESLSAEPGQSEPDNGSTAGIGGGSAADKVVAKGASLQRAPGALAAPSEHFTFATLSADRTDPNHINPSLPADEWMCSLGKMQGNYQNSWGGSQTYVDSNTNQWAVRAEGGVIARANCMHFSLFSGNIPSGASDTERWRSGMFTRMDDRGDCRSFRVAGYTWWGDAATIMTGAWGGFFGAAESVNVGQSADPRGPSAIYNTLCGQDMVVTDGFSFFVGDPGRGVAARFRGPPFINGNALEAPEYVADRSRIVMAPLDEAFCYFTSIRGAFAGDGELAEIVAEPKPDENDRLYWTMRTASQQGQLRAKARCFLLNQTTP